MTFREVPSEDLSLNPMIMIGGEWWLIRQEMRKQGMEVIFHVSKNADYSI